MIEKLVDKIISKQLEENTISTEDINIYRYGYILVYEVFVNIIVAAIIAGISGEWLLVTLFLVIYIPLRSFCGGWHADKFWKCTIYSNVIIVIMLISKETVMDMNNIWLLFGIFIICSICIFCLAPVDTVAKPISEYEKKIYSKKIRIIMLMHSVIYITMIVMECNEIAYLITFSYLTQVTMLIIEKICRKIGKILKSNEKCDKIFNSKKKGGGGETLCIISQYATIVENIFHTSKVCLTRRKEIKTSTLRYMNLCQEKN